MGDSVEGELRWFGYSLDREFKELKVIPLNDFHYGNPLCSLKHIDRTLNFINDNDNVRAICIGDLCESVLRTSKGDIHRQVGTPQDQRDWVIEKLYPVRNKILALTTGNHEERIYKETGIDISKDIAEALEVPYRAEGILLKIAFGNGNNRQEGKPYVYWCYATHGYGGARTKAAKAVKAERLSTWIHADFYIMSHDHVVNVAPDIYLIPDTRGTSKDGVMTGKITAHRKMLVKSNAYLKWGGYSENLGFPPTDLETPIIKLFGTGKPQVKVEV